MDYSIQNLFQIPKYILPTIKILYQQWSYYFNQLGLTSVELAYQELKTTLTLKDLPLKLVMIEKEQVIGTVGLDKIENGVPIKYKTKPYPWLVDLWVSPTKRSLGLGKKLIQAILNQARKMGYKKIYLWTENCKDYYLKQKWKLIEITQIEDKTLYIMKYYL